MSQPNDHETLRNFAISFLRTPEFQRATFAGVQRGAEQRPWTRVTIAPVEIGGQRRLQFSYFDAKQHIAKNYRERDIDEPLDELLMIRFAGIHMESSAEQIDIRTTKKGKVQIGRRNVAPRDAPTSAHNRIKDVALPEGRANRLLEALGVQTRDGHIRPAMRAKFTQINEFLKHLRHSLDEGQLRTLGRPVEILDCGCGLSFLTLSVHHYLNDILNIPANIVGVDVNDEVIRKSAERAEHLGADGVKLACTRIAAVPGQPDIVLALHACDTATDDAIALAINREAKLLMCVPCCHHDLNQAISASGPAEVLRPILRHGILHERMADLVTDSFRALILRVAGYRTEVVEFISQEHTSRNLMIRAVRGLPAGVLALVNEYRDMCAFWGVTPYLERCLGERWQRLLTSSLTGATE